MTGLNKIIDRIAEDSKAKCDDILLEAKGEADKIKAAAEEQVKLDTAAVVEQANKEAKLTVEMANSGSEQEAKKQILATKVHILDKAIEAALSKLKNLPEGEYFDTIYRLVKANAQDTDGILYLGAKDLARLPADFAEKVNEATKGNIKVAEAAKDISDGFILAYGEIEINCTFDALIASAKDSIKDELHKIIFA